MVDGDRGDVDEVVLAWPTELEAPPVVARRWRPTAGDVDDVLEGDVEMRVEASDQRESLDRLLFPPEVADDGLRRSTRW